MSAPTYQLDVKTSNADNYYRDVAELVGEVIETGQQFRGLTASYRRFLAQKVGTSLRSHEELLLELVMLGVLWRARGREATDQSATRRNLVTELVRERRSAAEKRRDGSVNELLDFDTPLDCCSVDPCLSDLARLNDWLLATGEYDDEVKRLDGWLEFFKRRCTGIAETLRAVAAFATSFEIGAERKLGRYTTRVGQFLVEELSQRRHREDAAQCSHRRVEYHFSLFGAELLNRAWREEFLACQTRVVVLSACLRSQTETNCRAIRSEVALQCVHCTRGCLVSLATQLAQRHGAATVAVIHGSDYTRFLRAAHAQGAGTGIIGVACAPGIVGAGFRARALGLPAQCVVLHSSGCSHWRSEEVPSSFELNELECLLSGLDRTSVATGGRRDSLANNTANSSYPSTFVLPSSMHS